jgi:hypothetical protein
MQGCACKQGFPDALLCCFGLQDADESHAAVLSSLLHLPEAFAPQEHNRIKQHNSSVQRALASQDVKVSGGGSTSGSVISCCSQLRLQVYCACRALGMSSQRLCIFSCWHSCSELCVQVSCACRAFCVRAWCSCAMLQIDTALASQDVKVGGGVPPAALCHLSCWHSCSELHLQLSCCIFRACHAFIGHALLLCKREAAMLEMDMAPAYGEHSGQPAPTTSCTQASLVYV